MFPRTKIENVAEWRIKPFKIIGNVYFVGTYHSSSHLIDTGDGLILVDVGHNKSLYLVINSIYELGFNPKDIKYIFITHWHRDHSEATELLKALTGAKTMIGEKDEEKAKAFFNADITIKDGDTLTLGNTTLNFMETPGHTRGTISFFMNVIDNGKNYRVGMFGGTGQNTLQKGRFDFEGCREAYLDTLNRLRKEKVDVFIGNHVWDNDTNVKGAMLLETGNNAFIDDKLWGKFLDFCEKRYYEVLSEDYEQK